MKKVIILDYVHANVSILSITDKLLDLYEDDIEDILINEYEFYHPEIEWMELELDEFGNFEVYQDTLYERKS
jgi:hypothetical protein